MPGNIGLPASSFQTRTRTSSRASEIARSASSSRHSTCCRGLPRSTTSSFRSYTPASARTNGGSAPPKLSSAYNSEIDSTTSEEIMRVFEGLAEQGQTVIMVTHESDIAAHARRVIVLRDGSVASDDKRATFIKSAGIAPPDLTRKG